MWTREVFDRIIGRLEGVKRSGENGELSAHCPCAENHRHGDRKHSFHIRLTNDGTILFHCKRGCSQESLRRALGLEKRDLYEPRDRLPFSKRAAKKKQKPVDEKSSAEIDKTLEKLEADPDCRRGVERFARKLGIPFQVLWDVGCRWKRIEMYPKNPLDPGELWWPECDGDYQRVGIGVRTWDGNKFFVSGGHRGIVVLDKDILKRPGPIYLVEGLTDTSALLAMGACVIGRPSNMGGVEFLSRLLWGIDKSREIIVVGENDKKDDKSWPGREGAEQTARQLADALKRPVKAALLPPVFKDTREWYQRVAATSTKPKDAYREFLSIIATFPLRAVPVTDEELDEAIESCKKLDSKYTYPDELCPRPGHMLLWHLKKKKIRNTLNRCGSSACPQCFKRKKRMRYESLVSRFEELKLKGGRLYCDKRVVTKKEWDTIRKSIKRAGCDFVLFRLECGVSVIISTHPFQGSKELPFETANEYTKDAVEKSVVLGPRRSFYSSSTRWAMRREKKEKIYKRLGNLHIPPQMVRLVVEMVLGSGKYRMVRPKDKDSLVNGYIDYKTEDPDNDDFVKLLLGKDFSCLSESKNDYMHHSDSFPPNDYGKRCIPWFFDVYWDGMLDPTG